MKFLIKIKYLGTSFAGFQYQPNARTVQGELTAASRKVFGCECLVTGCSRTDSGVHANCFFASVEPVGEKVASIPLEKIPVAYCSVLPEDISVFCCERIEDSFHPRYTEHRKEYVYKILNTPITDPFFAGRAWHLPRVIDKEGIANMQSAARHFVGKHDFSSFMAEGSKIVDTVREIYCCRVSKEGDMITIAVCADGFLYNMVRIIVGTLADVGLGKKSPDSMPDIILSHSRSCAGPTAPPEGLYLDSVMYDHLPVIK